MKISLYKVFLFVCALAFSSQAWGLTSKADKATLHDNFNNDEKRTTWSGSHVTFAFSGSSLYTKLGWLYIPHNATYILDWNVDEGYRITVTRVAVDVERASGTGYKMTVGNGSKSANLFFSWNVPTGGITSGVMNLGNDDQVTVAVSKAGTWSTCAVKSISVEYTIEPTVYVFDGSGKDETRKDIWSQDDNWDVNATPTIDHTVIIRHDVLIEDEVSAYSVIIEDGYSLTIAPTGGLTVGAGGIIGADKDNLFLRAGQEGDVRGQTGYLRVSPESTTPMPAATVELFTRAYYDMSASDHQEEGQWQFIGIPVEGGAKAKTVFSQSWLYNWGTETEEWLNNRKTLTLAPFDGYATSQYTNRNGLRIVFEGQLVANEDRTIELAYNAGQEYTQNMLANSFAAPIDITRLEDSDFQQMQGAIYLFNTGSRADIKQLASSRSGSYDTPGQYLAIPIGSAAAMKDAFGTPTVVPSMQGFCVHATGEGARLTLDYDKLVYRATSANAPLRVARRARKADESLTGALCVSLYSEAVADNLYLLEADRFDATYENGLDARKMTSGEANIFAVEGEEQLAVDATSSLAGTQLGMRTGDTTAYVLLFSRLQSVQPLALEDAATGETIDIEEGTEYQFEAAPNTLITNRFRIVVRDESAQPGVSTDLESAETAPKARKVLRGGQIMIEKNGVRYSLMGSVVR